MHGIHLQRILNTSFYIFNYKPYAYIVEICLHMSGITNYLFIFYNYSLLNVLRIFLYNYIYFHTRNNMNDVKKYIF